jgi:hypothetical protein
MIIADILKNLFALCLIALVLSMVGGTACFVMEAPKKARVAVVLVFIVSLIGAVLLTP